jgi:hypothetical protein
MTAQIVNLYGGYLLPHKKIICYIETTKIFMDYFFNEIFVLRGVLKSLIYGAVDCLE